MKCLQDERPFFQMAKELKYVNYSTYSTFHLHHCGLITLALPYICNLVSQIS